MLSTVRINWILYPGSRLHQLNEKWVSYTEIIRLEFWSFYQAFLALILGETNDFLINAFKFQIWFWNDVCSICSKYKHDDAKDQTMSLIKFNLNVFYVERGRNLLNIADELKYGFFGRTRPLLWIILWLIKWFIIRSTPLRFLFNFN